MSGADCDRHPGGSRALHQVAGDPTPREGPHRDLRRGNGKPVLSDPATNPDAELLHELDYMHAISEQLGIMDTTAVTMCMENNLPIRVFNMTTPGNVGKAVRGEPVGTVVDARRAT